MPSGAQGPAVSYIECLVYLRPCVSASLRLSLSLFVSRSLSLALCLSLSLSLSLPLPLPLSVSISLLSHLLPAIRLTLPSLLSASPFFGTGLMGTWLNGYLILQGNIPLRNLQVKHILKLLAGKILGTRWAKYPFGRCRRLFSLVSARQLDCATGPCQGTGSGDWSSQNRVSGFGLGLGLELGLGTFL